MKKREGLRVLIVEDREDDRDLLTQLMKRVQEPALDITVCPDGTTAIAKLETGNFDCVFLDYNLPDLNGMEIMDKAKAICPDAEIVMITSQGNEELAVAAMKAGAFDYWVKGRFSKDALERTFHSLQDRMALKRTIKKQEEDLLDAERQRVMLESIGAACHHFSQPVTSLLGRLEILLARNPPLPEEDKELLRECFNSSKRMSDLVQQFQNIREYRTVPYVEDYDIIDIESHPPKGSEE